MPFGIFCHPIVTPVIDCPTNVEGSSLGIQFVRVALVISLDFPPKAKTGNTLYLQIFPRVSAYCFKVGALTIALTDIRNPTSQFCPYAQKHCKEYFSIPR